ncbi:uncharacterized protein A1O9_11838 [Exophiala aquamarina CBS 119918]|uniref:Uncharacterized protein n=1 Tax=Exophiala aquamarina CBS 119918 TaxID=1182545 RepID=A0A072NXA4_9EURO|nr:uncharacterized protein A1O9_11838 [Exophiala aquamarina CBS 119918]KEF52211.1 hypothetical protein A1O9_11838 [Exophiala aquamarina CBS 119918]
MLGPEFIFMLALGQYVSARASVKAFHALEHKEWTMKHAFYADMGGIIFQPKEWNSFPINAAQLQYLVEKQYVDYPQIAKSEIDDKDKSDGLARFVEVNVSPPVVPLTYICFSRFITSMQMIWFTLNVVARASQKLAVTTIEITTVAYVFCTLGTLFCWRRKPMEVSTRVLLRSNYTIHQILRDGGRAASKPYVNTPLEFIDHKEWAATQLWKFNVNILRKFHVVRQRPLIRPAQRISSFNFPRLTQQAALGALLMALGYAAIFLAAWNLDFPSSAECLLWRICTAATVGLTFITGVVEIFLAPTKIDRDISDNCVEKEAPRRDINHGVLSTSAETSKTNPTMSSTLLPSFFKHQECQTQAKKGTSAKTFFRIPSKTITRFNIPLHSLLITELACAIYSVCRICILTEDLVGLRALPPSTFQNVDWAAYWPHI